MTIILNSVKKIIKEYDSLLLCLGIYCLLAFFFLGSSPLIWYDEGLLSDVSWYFVKEGVFAQPLWTGYLGYGEFSTHPNYLYFSFLALSFKIFGHGIFQARLVSAVSGLLLVLVFYIFLRELWSKKFATIATLLLIFNPLFILSSRIVRQEMLVTLLGFLAMSFVILGYKRQEKWRHFIGGFFAALTILVHVNGFFVSFATLLLLFIKKKEWSDVLYYLGGIIIPLVPYFVFLFLNKEIFIEQFSGLVSYRIPFSFSSIFANIVGEPFRWIKGITTPLSLSVGILSFLFLIPKWKKFMDFYILLVILILSFAISDHYKYYGYLVILLPLFSILSAFFFMTYFQKPTSSRVALFTLIFVLIANFSVIEYKLLRDYSSDYQSYCHNIKEIMGTDEKEIILGDALYWFCFPNGNLRGIIEQVWIHEVTEKSFSEIFKEQNITYILLDPATAIAIQSHKGGLFPIPEEYFKTIEEMCKIKGKAIDDYYTKTSTPLQDTIIYECG